VHALLCYPAAKIPFSAAPEDDRNLPDMHLALYNDTIVFDQATKLVYVICWVHLDDDTTSVSSSSSNGSSNGASASSSSRDPEALREAFDAGKQRLQGLVRQLSTPPPSLAPAQVDMALSQLPAPPGKSNVTKQQFLDAVLAAKEYILVSWASAGGIPAEVHLGFKGTGSGPMELCQTASATSGQIATAF
jgi:anthranilate synthase component 1